MTKHVLLIYTKKIAFVKEDHDTLTKFAKVTELPFKANKKPLLLLSAFIKQFYSLLIKIKKVDTLYIWFADYHALLPILFAKLFNKNTIIILGGYDTMALPSIDYGIFIKKNIRRWIAKYTIRHTNHLLGVDESMFETTNSYINNNGLKNGVNHFVKNIKGNRLVVPTGYDTDKWVRNPNIKKEKLIVTIGSVTQMKGLKRKGFDFFTQVARLLPDYQFIIIGPNNKFKKYLEQDAPKNLTVHGFMKQVDFMSIISKAKVFCQFSLAEGLPNTLCEAMLCECIPVGSSVNGIPKAIGNKHLIIEQPDTALALKAINYAIQMTAQDGVFFRNRISTMFPKSKREQAIQQTI